MPDLEFIRGQAESLARLISAQNKAEAIQRETEKVSQKKVKPKRKRKITKNESK